MGGEGGGGSCGAALLPQAAGSEVATGTYYIQQRSLFSFLAPRKIRVVALSLPWSHREEGDCGGGGPGHLQLPAGGMEGDEGRRENEVFLQEEKHEKELGKRSVTRRGKRRRRRGVSKPSAHLVSNGRAKNEISFPSLLFRVSVRSFPPFSLPPPFFE